MNELEIYVVGLRVVLKAPLIYTVCYKVRRVSMILTDEEDISQSKGTYLMSGYTPVSGDTLIGKSMPLPITLQQ